MRTLANSSAFDRIVGALHNVETRGTTAKAGCPLCQSQKGRPVVVRDTGDGRVLMHGFCGHGTDEILGAVGLSMSDLFDAPRGEHKPMARSSWNARDVLELAIVEIHVVGIVASDIQQRRTISEQDWQRLSQASGRLIAMATEVAR